MFVHRRCRRQVVDCVHLLADTCFVPAALIRRSKRQRIHGSKGPGHRHVATHFKAAQRRDHVDLAHGLKVQLLPFIPLHAHRMQVLVVDVPGHRAGALRMQRLDLLTESSYATVIT